jgi:hypothetical protein
VGESSRFNEYIDILDANDETRKEREMVWKAKEGKNQRMRITIQSDRK